MGGSKFERLFADKNRVFRRECHGCPIDKIELPLSMCGSMQWTFKDKVALVTGAGRGIGQATAVALAAKGCRVALISRTQSELEETRKRIEAAGGQAIALPADLSDERAIAELFETVTRKWGPVQILVNNAGMFHGALIGEQQTAEFDAVMAVNVRAVFLCTREIFRSAAAGNEATIINVASISGVRGVEKFPGMAAYIASKFAVIGLTEASAVEGRALGVRVCCLAPGAVETRMLREAAPHLKTQTTPDQIARTIVMLADEAQSSHLNGAVIEVFSNLA